MAKITIIADDGAVIIDGEAYTGLLFSLPDNTHAVQWNDTQGHVEIKDAYGRMFNYPIDSIAPYSDALTAWADAKSAAEAEAQAIADAEAAEKAAEEAARLEAQAAQAALEASPEYKISVLKSAVQSHLDNTAKERGYDNIMSACTYATSTNPQFAAEGQACVAWRDSVWAYCYNVLSDYNAGIRSEPTAEALLAELPTFSWPV